MTDGELDQSGLTMNDIAVIKEKFIQFLITIFHPRISYPGQEGEEGTGKENESNIEQPSQGDRQKRV